MYLFLSYLFLSLLSFVDLYLSPQYHVSLSLSFLPCFSISLSLYVIHSPLFVFMNLFLYLLSFKYLYPSLLMYLCHSSLVIFPHFKASLYPSLLFHVLVSLSLYSISQSLFSFSCFSTSLLSFHVSLSLSPSSRFPASLSSPFIYLPLLVSFIYISLSVQWITMRKIRVLNFPSHPTRVGN